LKDKTSAATTEAMVKRFAVVPKKLKKTVTLDNGFENTDWQGIEKKTKLKCFYAHAYRSCERGTNENTNGLIRDYFPKKTDSEQSPLFCLVINCSQKYWWNERQEMVP
jgi:IS30 family transposase